eukprot:jgi/Mesvir1/5401/Mv15474-RA.1
MAFNEGPMWLGDGVGAVWAFVQQYGYYLIAFFVILKLLLPHLKRRTEHLFPEQDIPTERLLELEQRRLAARERQQQEAEARKAAWFAEQERIAAEKRDEQIAALEKKASALGIKPKGPGHRLGSDVGGQQPPEPSRPSQTAPAARPAPTPSRRGPGRELPKDLWVAMGLTRD